MHSRLNKQSCPMKSPIFLVIFLMLLLPSCKEEGLKMPRQRMYPFIDFPSRKDTLFSKSSCNFTFPLPAYFSLRQDSFYFGEVPLHDCWFDLYNQNLGASLHCSYYDVTSRSRLDQLINDAFEITGKHNIRANARRESLISNGNGVSGILFEVDGPVASPLQFFVTDSTTHFFRASLYFNAKVNPDSTAPVLQFIRQDIDKMITGFKWK